VSFFVVSRIQLALYYRAMSSIDNHLFPARGPLDTTKRSGRTGRTMVLSGTRQCRPDPSSGSARVPVVLLFPGAAAPRCEPLNRVQRLQELAVPPGNRLERLRSDRAGQHSIRVNDRYRVCFRWEDEYANEVEVTDYH
jgi:proteic killer suppression protein